MKRGNPRQREQRRAKRKAALQVAVVQTPDPKAAMRTRYRKAGITARKFGGDDSGSWAVFLNGRPVYTGLTIHSVSYYKNLVLEMVERKERT